MLHPAVSLLMDMLRVYTPSGREAPLAELLAERMKASGFRSVRLDEASNVSGVVGEGRPVTLLCGHTDTIPGQQPVVVTERLIYGRGACDAKSALAAMVCAASQLAGRRDIGTVIVAGVSDEEGAGRGMRELLRGGVEADYAVFGEPSGLNNITIAYKGSFNLKLTCRTTSVHASAPWMTENAIERLMEVWQAIRRRMEERGNPRDRYNSVTACLTKIRGGSASNVTPGRCELVVNVRVPPRMTCAQVAGDLESVTREFQRDISFPKLDVRVDDSTEPFEADRSSPLVRALIRAVLRVRGRRPMLVRKTGTGDMNTLGRTLGIPAVTYGPGNSHLSHTRRECVEVAEYVSSIDVYKEALLEIRRIAPSGT